LSILKIGDGDGDGNDEDDPGSKIDASSVCLMSLDKRAA